MKNLTGDADTPEPGLDVDLNPDDLAAAYSAAHQWAHPSELSSETRRMWQQVANEYRVLRRRRLATHPVEAPHE